MRQIHLVEIQGTEYWIRIVATELKALKKHCKASGLKLVKDVRKKAGFFDQTYWSVERMD